MVRRTGSKTRGRSEPHLRIDLTTDDLDTLVRVVDHYQKSMGPMRHLVRLTGSRETRRRFRFLEEESEVLHRLARATSEAATGTGREVSSVPFTPLAAVAFWGRLLSSLRSTRSRRRLRPPEIARREAMAEKLCNALSQFERLHPELVANAVDTRRRAEQEWMRDALTADVE